MQPQSEINAERVIQILSEKIGEYAGREAVTQTYIETLERRNRELEAELNVARQRKEETPRATDGAPAKA